MIGRRINRGLEGEFQQRDVVPCLSKTGPKQLIFQGSGELCKLPISRATNKQINARICALWEPREKDGTGKG